MTAITSIKKIIMAAAALLVLTVLSACTVGSDSYKEPWEIDPDYCYSVTYDALEGTINTLNTRELYYKSGALLKKPDGKSGVLIEPVNGSKVVLGWYTQITNVGTEEKPEYEYDDAYLWNFEKDRISDETTDENKKMTLYARWSDPPTFLFVDSEDHEKIYLTWKKTQEDEKISRPTSTEPTKTGFTLLDYYEDAECKEKLNWGDEGKTVGEFLESNNGETNIYIYCKFIPGDYVRVKSAQAWMTSITPDGKYILANDIDFANTAFELPVDENGDAIVFTGEIISDNYSIKNLTINAQNRVSGIAAANAHEKSFGLFGGMNGAKISGLVLNNVTVNVQPNSNVAMRIGVFGADISGCNFENVVVDQVKVVSNGKITVQLTLKEQPDDTNTMNDCSFETIDVSGLSIEEDQLITG